MTMTNETKDDTNGRSGLQAKNQAFSEIISDGHFGVKILTHILKN